MGKRSRKRAGGAATTDPGEPRPKREPRPAVERPPRSRKEPELGSLGRIMGGQTYGERPDALWGKWPVSEFMIFAGLIALVVGVIRGEDGGPEAFTVGIALCAIGVAEFTAREHFRGYRSHSLLLALLAVVLLLALFALIAGDDAARSPVAMGVAAAVFLSLSWYLYVFFRKAKQRRRTTR